jgi:hypothetical protein
MPIGTGLLRLRSEDATPTDALFARHLTQLIGRFANSMQKESKFIERLFKSELYQIKTQEGKKDGGGTGRA